MGSGRFVAGVVAGLIASAAFAVDTTPRTVRVIVPVVGSVTGVGGARWKTDVVLRNDGRAEATVALSLPTAPDQPVIITTIPPADSLRFTDVVNEAFGVESAISPLVVETLGNRSVAVSATTYAVTGTEVSPPQPIAVQYGTPFTPFRFLNNLSFSDDFRTNIGLANLGETSAEFVLALQRVAGRNVAVSKLTVPPNSLVHTSLQSLFPLITNGNDFAVLIETPAADTFVYASVIENATNTARFVQPAIGIPMPEAQRVQQARQ
jgi:hypothetical protein